MRFFLLQIILFSQLLFSYCNSQESSDSTTNKIDLNQEVEVDTTKKETPKEISLLFLGDIMGHDLQIESAYNKNTGKYDFSTEFEHIQPFVKDVDATIGNLEVTLAGPPYKGYPKFSSPDQLAIDIKNAGINYLTTANNHIYDRGLEGFRRTVDVLDSLGFKHTGSFKSEEYKKQRHPLIIEENGWKVALLNYTYAVNGGVYDKRMLLNELDTAVIRKDLIETKKGNYDAIIVYFHWGQEYKRNSNLKQQKIANMCFENGANVVVGAHPHVIQEMSKHEYTYKNGQKKDVLVAYSLGNYVANYGSWRYSNGGALLRFKLKKTETGEIKIEEQGYYLVWVYRKAKTGKLKTYYVLPIDQYENDKTLGAEHTRLMKTFINDSRTHLKKYNNNVNEYKFNKSTNKWEVSWK